MNYVKIYDSLITKCRPRGTDKRKLNYYTELHHIVPKSMGGEDTADNLVLLTAREHFIAHVLLSKIYNNSEMNYALWIMCITRTGVKIHSRFYESVRIKHSKRMSKLLKGAKRTESHKTNLSIALKGRLSPTKGKFLTVETRKKISNSLKGKIQSEETRRKRSDSQKGKKKNLYPPCPHCGKVASKATAIRWHYDNCKLWKSK